MNNYLLLIISMFCALGASIIKKASAKKFESKNALRFLFNATVSLSCVFVFLLLGGIPEISGFTLALGILFGFITAFQYFFSLKSYESGPFAYTSVIVSLSTIIPALSGYFIWNENLVAIQMIGILMMLLCFLLSVEFKKEENKASKAWFAYVFLTFFATGFIGVMQKWHQSSEYKNELNGFLIVAFSVSFMLCFLGFLFLQFRQKERSESCKITVGDVSLFFLCLMILCGICAALNNKMNLYLSGVMDSAIFFPVVNGGGIILSTLTSIFLFKEKLSLQKCLGIAVGVIAVVLLCNPF